LKLCTDSTPASTLPPYIVRPYGGNVETNVIADDTINGHKVNKKESPVTEKPQCVLCEFIMKEVEDQLKDNKTDAQIENAVKNVCKILPSSVKKECQDFIDQNAENIIQLLISMLDPSDICTFLKFCGNGGSLETIRVEILECPICEATVEVMQKILANPNVDHTVEHVIEKTCRGLPSRYRSKCQSIVEDYGDLMIKLLIENTDRAVVCKKIGYCKSYMGEVVID